MPIATTAQLNTAIEKFLKGGSSLAQLYRTTPVSVLAESINNNPQLQSALSAGLLPRGTTFPAPTAVVKPPVTTAPVTTPAAVAAIDRNNPPPVGMDVQSWNKILAANPSWTAKSYSAALANTQKSNQIVSAQAAADRAIADKMAAAKAATDKMVAQAEATNAANKAIADAKAADKVAADKVAADKVAADKAAAESKAALEAKTTDYQNQLLSAATPAQLNDVVANARADGITLASAQIQSATSRLINDIHSTFIKAQNAGTITQDQLDTYQTAMKDLGRPVAQSNIDYAQKKVDYNTQQAARAKQQAAEQVTRTQTGYAKTAEFIKTNKPTGLAAGLTELGSSIYSIPDNPGTADVNEGGWYRSVETAPGKYAYQQIGADGAPTGPVIPQEEFNKTKTSVTNQIQTYKNQQAQTQQQAELAARSEKQAEDLAIQQQARYTKTADWLKTAPKPSGLQTSAPGEILLYSMPDNPATADVDEGGYYRSQQSADGRYSYQKIGADGAPTGPVIPQEEFTKTRSDLLTQTRAYEAQQTQAQQLAEQAAAAEKLAADRAARTQADYDKQSKAQLQTQFNDQAYAVRTQADLDAVLAQAKAAGVTIDPGRLQQAQSMANRTATTYAKTADFIKSNKPSGMQAGLTEVGQALSSIPDNPATADVDEGGWYADRGGGMQRIGADGAPTGPVIPYNEFTKNKTDLVNQVQTYRTEQAARLKTKTDDYRSRLTSAESAKQFNDIMAEGQADGVDLSKDPYAKNGFAGKQYSAYVQALNNDTLTQEQLDNYIKTMSDIGQPLSQTSISQGQQRVDYRAQQSYTTQLQSATSQDQVNAIVNKAKDTKYAIPDFQVKAATDRVARQENTYAKIADFVKTAKPTGMQAGLTEFGHTIYSLPDDPTTKPDESGWYESQSLAPGKYGLQRIGADGRPSGPVIPSDSFDTQKQTIQANAYNYQVQAKATANLQDFLANKSAIEGKLPAPGSDGWMRGGYKSGPTLLDGTGNRKASLLYYPIPPNPATGDPGAWAVSNNDGRTWRPIGQSGVAGEPEGPSISNKEVSAISNSYNAYLNQQSRDRYNARVNEINSQRNSGGFLDMFDDLLTGFDDLVNDTIGWKTIATIAGSAVGGPWGAAMANATAGAIAGEDISTIARGAALTFAMAYGTQALGEALASSAEAAVDAGLVDTTVADTFNTGMEDLGTAIENVDAVNPPPIDIGEVSSPPTIPNVSPELDPGAYIPDVSPELDPGAYIPEPVAPIVPDVPVTTPDIPVDVGPVIPDVPVITNTSELPQPITDEFGEIISYETPSEIVNNIDTNAPVKPYEPFGPAQPTDVAPVAPGPTAPEIVTNDVGERFVLNPDGTMTPYQDPNIMTTPGLPTTEPVLTPVGTPTVEIMEPVAPVAPPPVNPAEQYFKDLVDGGMDIKEASDLTDLRFPRSDIPTEVEITGVGVTNPTAPELSGTGPVGPVAPSDLPTLITYGGLQPGEIIATLTPEQIAIMGGSAAALATVTAVISAGGNPATVIPSATTTPAPTAPTAPTAPVTPEPVIAPVEPPPVITPEPVAPPVTPVEPVPVAPPVTPEPVPIDTPVIPVVTPPVEPPVTPPPVEPPVTPPPVEPPVTPPPVEPPVTPPPVEPPITPVEPVPVTPPPVEPVPVTPPPVEPVPVIPPPVAPPVPPVEPPITPVEPVPVTPPVTPPVEPVTPPVTPPGPTTPPGPVTEPPIVVPPVVAPPGPVTPGPVTELPVTPGPVTELPVTPGPVTPGPVTPGPVTPGPVTPGPVTPGPVTPGPVTEPPVVIPPIIPPVVTPPVTPPVVEPPPVTEPPKPYEPYEPDYPVEPEPPIDLPIIIPIIPQPYPTPTMPRDPYPLISFAGTNLVNPGLNPGYVVTGVNPPMYQTTNPYQSQYYWGQRDLMKNMADLARYNQVPGAPAVPFGLQAGPNFDWNQYLAQLAQTPAGPVAPGTGTA